MARRWQRAEENRIGLVWGIKEIAAEIGRTPRQTYTMLVGGSLPAKLVGRRWCASREELRRFFSNLGAAA